MKRSIMVWMLATGLLLTGVLPAAAKGFNGPGHPGGPGPGWHGKGPGPGWQQDNRLREDARQVMFRTANVLKMAQVSANRFRDNRRGLGQAFAQQRYAQDLYSRGNYRDAIFHSLRARELALEIIRRNRGSIQHDWEFNDWELRYRHEAPSDHDLDGGIHGFFMGDDDAVHFNIEFNF